MENILIRILNRCNELGINKTTVLKEVGINTSFFSEWKKGKVKAPSYEKIVKIAEYLEISLDYLTYGKENFSDLSEDEEKIISIYRQLDIKEKYKLLGMFELKLSELNDKKIKSLNLDSDANIA